jgi:putative hemolysin
MRSATASILSRALELTPIGRAYLKATAPGSEESFGARALSVLDVRSSVVPEQLGHIPAEGPLIVVANHPFGLVDGLLILHLLSQRRHDVKLLGNRVLGCVPELLPWLIPVDVFRRRGDIVRNATAIRESIRWLSKGGCLVMFPAGEVAYRVDGNGLAVDSDWRTTAAELAVRTGADVLPAYFGGANSHLFRAVGRIHPFLRTALLVREMWARRGSTVAVQLGNAVTPQVLARFPDAATRTQFLRHRVEALSGGVQRSNAAWTKAPAVLADRGTADELEDNIAQLQRSMLLESGSFQVFCAAARELPAVLPEIGRLREMTFRQVGEGSGLARDLDRFDGTYQHLFVWDCARKQIAGAYRVGPTDVVAASGRVEGLYTRTLFDYDSRLLDQIGPALELGRSFVQPEYQREFSPLLLLWKGISRIVFNAPRYRRLFGVVSISDLYNSTSRQLLLKFLQTRRFDADLGRLVRAKNPPPPPGGGPVESATISSMEEVSAFVRRIEPDGKDVPVLLRQYLKLNARLIGFTLDPSFGNVLDGLVVVNLADVEPALLSRYMGRAEARAFLRNAQPH